MSLDAANTANQDSQGSAVQAPPGGSSTSGAGQQSTTQQPAGQAQNQQATIPGGDAAQQAASIQAAAGTTGAAAGAAEQDQPAADPFLTRLAELGFEGLTTRAEAEERLFQDYEQRRQQAEKTVQLEQQLQWLNAQIGLNRGQQPGMFQPAGQAAGQQSSAPAQTTQRPAPAGLDQFSAIDQSAVAQASKYRKVVVENGEEVTQWAPNTPVAVREQYERAEAAVNHWQTALLTRPHEVIPQIIEHFAAPVIEQRVQAQLSQIEEQRQYENVLAENPWMLQVDPRTNRPQRNTQGQYVYSDAGNQVLERLTSLYQNGFAGPTQFAWQLALSGMAPQQGQQPQRQSMADRMAAATQTRDANRAAALRPQPGNGFQQPPVNRDRGGSFGPNGQAGGNDDFGHDALRTFKAMLAANGAN